ncbi:hypothetical protein [Sphingobium bisphenolivorans]|uniref:hypothetical protein n=1 Tax=Sphingobium bisphenolivorans TaxID=1335760 RepID=UPI00039CDC2E|nr:hypothetical protein [Sphingobium bisphenolivorans]
MNLNLRQTEGAPEAYPEVEGVTGDDLAVAWMRVEHYTKVRFTAREVEWIVQGETGCVWYPPLGPVLSIEGEIMESGVTFSPTPCSIGYHLPNGVVKLTASVGAGPVPQIVTIAVKRLAAYFAAEVSAPAGVRSHSLSVGDMSESTSFSPDRIARAMQESGAADLLRAYRSATPWLS